MLRRFPIIVIVQSKKKRFLADSAGSVTIKRRSIGNAVKSLKGNASPTGITTAEKLKA
jgi:hypothetical protein